MLVWNEISSMVLMMFAICEEVSLISSIAWSMSVILTLPSLTIFMQSSASTFAFPALSALAEILEDISTMEALSSSTVAACSVAACESVVELSLILLEPSDTSLLEAPIWRITSLVLLMMPYRADLIGA